MQPLVICQQPSTKFLDWHTSIRILCQIKALSNPSKLLKKLAELNFYRKFLDKFALIIRLSGSFIDRMVLIARLWVIESRFLVQSLQQSLQQSL